MGHAAGTKNYKKKVLHDVVKETLLDGSYAWEMVPWCIRRCLVSLNYETRMM